MDAEERQATILATARAAGRVDVVAIAAATGVAVETVRRDLRVLVDRGVLRRVHGGAVPVETGGFETDLAFRETREVGEKRRIAAAAARLLRGAETVYIDEGFTPRLIAEELATLGQRTIVTSSLQVAQVIGDRPEITVLLLGGRVRGRTMATVDHWALSMLRDLVLDVAFLGANGISRERGVTTPDPAVAAVKQEVVRQARRRILVGSHTRFGVSSFCRFGEIADFEAIVTGTELRPAEAPRYEALGPRVFRA